MTDVYSGFYILVRTSAHPDIWQQWIDEDISGDTTTWGAKAATETQYAAYKVTPTFINPAGDSETITHIKLMYGGVFARNAAGNGQATDGTYWKNYTVAGTVEAVNSALNTALGVAALAVNTGEVSPLNIRYFHPTNGSIATSAAETTLISQIIPAGVIKPGSRIQIGGFINFAGDATSTFTTKLKIGGVVVALETTGTSDGLAGLTQLVINGIANEDDIYVVNGPVINGFRVADYGDDDTVVATIDFDAAAGVLVEVTGKFAAAEAGSAVTMLQSWITIWP